MSLTDAQCIKRCLDGQPETFRLLIRRYEGRIAALTAAQLGNSHAATEAAQETFVRAYFALGKLKKHESFYSWLIGIASRVVKETRRKRAAAPGPLLTEPAAPNSQADQREPALRAAVTKLPEKYQQVIALRFYGDMSCKQIGQQLSVPLGTVTKRLSRAYALLRESVEVRKPDDIEVGS